MSTSKDGNDPKGKSVETAITNTFVTSYLLRGHNVQGIYVFYYGFLLLLCEIIFKGIPLSNLVYMLLRKKIIQ